VEIVLTKHLIEKAEKRQIDIRLVEECLKNPDYILPDPKDIELKWYVKKHNERCLVVVVKGEEGYYKSITVFYDRRLKRRGLCR
jgi:hypothetical protein